MNANPVNVSQSTAVAPAAATVAVPSKLETVKAFFNRFGLALLVFVLTAFPSISEASSLTPDPVRPTLDLDVNEMLFWMFEGANIIIVALGAVVFLTIGFVLGRKILELIRSAISSL
jgi:hypothetical protein